MTKMIDLTHRRFGRLQVIERAENRNKHVMWKCVCDCGISLLVSSTHLNSGHTQSCGCFKRDVTAERNKQTAKHGMWNTPEWNSWKGMIGRCHCKTNKKYPLYGGRGILVCDLWRESFKEFYGHVGSRPSDRHSIDRIDTNKGYEPGNVRWATITEQNNNRRSNVFTEIEGVKKTAAQVSRQFGITNKAALYRIKNGKPLV